MLNITDIKAILPHRYPMLLVDRILEVEPGVSSKGLKNVTANEAFFEGHYPGMPIMPGVLIVEFMAQSGAVMLLMEPEYKGMTPVIGAIDEVKFKRPVVPGDTLIAEGVLMWIRGSIGRVKSTATVDGEMVAQMEMTFKLLPK
ncbi:MAG: 3-hydroxyacyl-ACP dehydratase FabZ [Armatimonadetes bacterium]|nr:3-hydroxyacyl-ACP dehydratase FabZ [Armatimonadota bacterium]